MLVRLQAFIAYVYAYLYTDLYKYIRKMSQNIWIIIRNCFKNNISTLTNLPQTVAYKKYKKVYITRIIKNWKEQWIYAKERWETMK